MVRGSHAIAQYATRTQSLRNTDELANERTDYFELITHA